MSINRRNFIKSTATAGGGFILSLAFPKELSGNSNENEPTFSPNLLMELGTDSIVHFKYTRHEMGQGSFTGLSMIFANELGADWSKFEAKQVDYNLKYGDQLYGNTGGSNTVRSMWKPLKELAATARMMLIQAAADKWKVAGKDCVTQDSFVIHKPSKRRLPFGDLAEVASLLSVPKELKFKDPKDYKIVGQSVPNLNLDRIVDGKLPYSMDVKVPNMVYAAIARSPFYKGKVQSFNDEAARKVKGVIDVIPILKSDVEVIDDFSSMREGIAIIATNTWAAFEAKKLLSIQWNSEFNEPDTMDAIKKEMAAAKDQKANFTAFHTGDVQEKLGNAVRTFTQSYHNPYQVHALMEPPSATADFRENKCEIWSSVQHPKRILERASKAVDLPIEHFTFHNLSCGGSFGRRYYDDFVTEAVYLSKKIKSPVKVVWSREDEISTSGYHAHQKEEQTVALDENNNITAWQERSYMVAGQDELQWVYPLQPYYNQHRLQDVIGIKPRLPIMAWRSVQAHQHALGSECFIDELAHKLGKDPIQFRLELIEKQVDPNRFSTESSDGIFQFTKEWVTPRAKRVFEKLSKSRAWNQPLNPGFGRGVAGHSFGPTFVGQIAEVSVIGREINIHKITCVVDCGTVINPQLASGQIEGSIIWGLSALFYNNITLKQGVVEQSNFHDYPVVRIHEVPEIEVIFLESEEDPTGLGEPGLPPLAPAVLNAIFDASGQRIRKIPISEEDLV